MYDGRRRLGRFPRSVLMRMGLAAFLAPSRCRRGRELRTPPYMVVPYPPQAVAGATGVVLDPVYGGKALHQLLADMAAAPAQWAGRRVLFLHTGGLLVRSGDGGGGLAQLSCVVGRAAASQARLAFVACFIACSLPGVRVGRGRTLPDRPPPPPPQGMYDKLDQLQPLVEAAEAQRRMAVQL